MHVVEEKKPAHQGHPTSRSGGRIGIDGSYEEFDSVAESGPTDHI